jgi:cytochrome c oxidase subunit 4
MSAEQKAPVRLRPQTSFNRQRPQLNHVRPSWPTLSTSPRALDLDFFLLSLLSDRLSVRLCRISAACRLNSLFFPSSTSRPQMSLRYASQAVSGAAVRSSAAPMARFAAPAAAVAQQTRLSSGHAIANPTLAGIEKRWEDLPPQEQADLWMQLRDRMKVNWHELTLQEKKAGMFCFLLLFCVAPVTHGVYYTAYWIAFGAHGPRKETPKGEGWKIFSKVTQLVAASVAIFYSTRFFAGSPPRTMTKEWQEASNEYALVRSLLYIYIYIYISIYIYIEICANNAATEREDGPHHRYQQ